MATAAAVARLSAEDFEIPVLSEPDAYQWMADVLSHAVTERKGVAVIAPKGAGKSIAMSIAIEQFLEEEHALAAQKERAERRIQEVETPEADERGEFIRALWQSIYGMTEVRRARRRTADKEDGPLNLLIEHLISNNVAALVFDEAEKLSDEGMRVVRDIISRAEKAGKERRRRNAKIKAFGVGVVLMGTDEILGTIDASGEKGHRWIRIKALNLLTPLQAANVYRAYLGTFDRRARDMGEPAWAEFIRVRVALDKDMPIRHIENHVRGYVRRCLVEFPDVQSFDDLPYDDELFFDTLRELPR
jgi:hypothetical protein